MAGFFGLFNYEKPGPGVDKNAPKKKGFFIFLEIFFRKFWKLVTANLLYVLVNLPLVTGGLADAGLTYITRNFAREKHAFISADFFDTIKKNWKQALPVGLINLVLTIVITFDVWYFYNGAEGIGGYIMLAVIACVYIVFTFMKYYMSMMIITFKLSLKQIYKNSLIFAFAGLWRNLLISVVLLFFYALAGLLIFLLPFVFIPVVCIFYIFIFPAFRSFLIQYNIFPLVKKHMIDPYYEAHPEEDIKARHDLNLDAQVADGEEEAPVFQDMGSRDIDEEPEKEPLRIPKQYTERELRHKKVLTRDNPRGVDDDDGTI